jgi:hypothetical protein
MKRYLMTGALALVTACGVCWANNSRPGSLRLERGLQAQVGDRALVGLGSDWVNAADLSHDCHGIGSATQFVADENPYAGPAKIINKAVYLGGGVILNPSCRGRVASWQPIL